MSAELQQLADWLRAHVVALASHPRPPESREHEQSQRYITEQLRESGFEATAVTETLELLPWTNAASQPLPAHTVSTSKTLLKFACTNLITQPLPEDSALPLLIIGAHYDSIPESPGADDNASAVAALLELARWLRPRLDRADALRARVQLVAYDLEEYGLLGSYLHARKIKADGESLRGMISLEMLGYIDERPGSQNLPAPLAHLYPNIGNFLGVVGNEKSVTLLQQTVAAMKTIPGLPVEFIAVPGNGEMLAETRLSDHSPFWDLGYPALMISDTSFYRNPHYHRASDTPDTLDYTFLARVTQGVCAAVWQLLCAK